jgi:hypothetical protein
MAAAGAFSIAPPQAGRGTDCPRRAARLNPRLKAVKGNFRDDAFVSCARDGGPQGKDPPFAGLRRSRQPGPQGGARDVKPHPCWKFARAKLAEPKRLLGQHTSGESDGKPRVPTQNFASMPASCYRATVKIVCLVNVPKMCQWVSDAH